MPKHNWSGWPGAHCLKCGAEHALENALGMNWYDPVEETWDTEEHREIVEKADGYCPIEDEEGLKSKKEPTLASKETRGESGGIITVSDVGARR